MGVRACPDCGKVQDESNAFCPQCGKALAAPAARRPLPRRDDGGAAPVAPGPAVSGPVTRAPGVSELDRLFAELRQAERTMSIKAERSGKRQVYGCLVLVVGLAVLGMWVMSLSRSAP